MMRPSNSGQKTPRQAVKPDPNFSRSVKAPFGEEFILIDRLQVVMEFMTLNRVEIDQEAINHPDSARKKNESGSIVINSGVFKDENNKSISMIKKRRGHQRQVSAAVANVEHNLNHANIGKENFRVIDLGFLSPQARKVATSCVFKTSIDLASPRTTPIICAEILSNNSIKVPLAEQFLNKPEVPTPQIVKHQRTQSSQVKTRTHTTSDRVLTTATNTHSIPTDYSRNLCTEIDSAKKSRPSQKENNERMYKKLVADQLSPELKSLKKELENFQKRKFDRRPILIKNELRSQKLSFPEEEEENYPKTARGIIEGLREREQDNFANIIKEEPEHKFEEEEEEEAQENKYHRMPKFSFQPLKGVHEKKEEVRVLVETSVNTQKFKTPETSVLKPEVVVVEKKEPVKLGLRLTKERQSSVNNKKPVMRQRGKSGDFTGNKTLLRKSSSTNLLTYSIQSNKSFKKGMRMI